MRTSALPESPFPRHQPFVVHCSDPLSPRLTDAAFAAEAETAASLGFLKVLVDHDALVSGDMRRAMRAVRPDAPGAAVYRGWMMDEPAYGRLHEALAERGVALITPVAAYAACHHLPEAHAHVGRWMPETTWITKARLDEPGALAATLLPFGDCAVTVKDWVKSQAAGYWDEACLIPRASDPAGVERVVRRFRELQGDDLAGGLVFRRYVHLAQRGGVSMEWRAFAVDGVPVGCWPRFDHAGEPPPPADRLAAIAESLPSRFASFDLAPTAEGGWILLETGDGQVSGFPHGAAVEVLASLRDRMGPPRLR